MHKQYLWIGYFCSLLYEQALCVPNRNFLQYYVELKVRNVLIELI